MVDMVKGWYAVYTRSRAEKKVVEKLAQKGYTCYLPTIKTIRQWSDRKKKVELPLVSSYVFVQISEEERLSVLNIAGIVAFVSDKGKPAVIPEQQIMAMKHAVEGNMIIQNETQRFDAGQKVKIVNGPLSGFEGEYIKTANQSKFIIRLDALNTTLSVEVKASDVEKV